MSFSAHAQLWANDSTRPYSFDSWRSITLGEQLNAGAYGGTSKIHRIASPLMSRLVAKVFNDATLPRRRTQAAHDKLIFIAQRSQKLRDGYIAGASRVGGRPHVAWPEMPLYVGQSPAPGNLVGFLMPAFHGMHPLQLLYTPKHRKVHFPIATADTVLATAANLAAIVDQLHGGSGDSGILIADLTPRNILINTRYECRIIDADSFQYSVSRVVHGTNESTPGFRSPSMARASRAGTNLPRFTKADDAYALTIVLFHLLVDGAHPWRTGSRFEIDGVAPDEEDNMLARRFPYASPERLHPPRIRLQTYQRLPFEVRAAFEHAFLEEAPPAPAQWVGILGRARTTASFGYDLPAA